MNVPSGWIITRTNNKTKETLNIRLNINGCETCRRRSYLEYLNAIVAGISHHNVSLIIYGHSARKPEQTLFGTFGTECELTTAIHVENLNSMIIRITNDHSICARNGDVGRMLQAAGTSSYAAHFTDETSIRLKYLE